jgi:hypothetical protein
MTIEGLLMVSVPFPSLRFLLPPGHIGPLAAICLAMMIPGGSDARTAWDGADSSLYTVGTIRIIERPVFDESDSSLFTRVSDVSRPAGELARSLGRIANDVHIMTREEIIRQELLFAEGDLFDQRLLDETARHLRRLSIIGDIRITTDTSANRRINVQVLTHDRWSLSPTVSVQAGGGVSGFGLGVRESNFLGSGQRIELGYNRLSDRQHPDGGRAAFTEPRLFGGWWSASTQLAKADELTQASIDLQHPFYADAASWAARAFAGTGRIRIRQYENGIVSRDDYLNQENELVWGAVSSGNETKLQLSGAYYRLRSTSDSMAVRPFDNVDLLIASVSLLGRNYTTGTFIENSGRVEDVPLGYQVGLALGRNLHRADPDAVDYFFRVLGKVSAHYGGGLSGNYGATVTSYLVGGVPNEMTVTGDMLHFWKIEQNQTLFARATTVIGSHWSPSSQVTLGSFSGLRGYRSNEFSGQRMVVFNLEHRIFSLVNVWFLRLGAAFFFDSGTVWNMGDGFGGQKFHSSAGIGVIAESGKNGGSGIFRFDVAYTMEQRRVGLVLSLDHPFRIFSTMEFVPPIPGAENPTRSR